MIPDFVVGFILGFLVGATLITLSSITSNRIIRKLLKNAD